MTPQEINQLAAARMVAATLHNVLKSVLEEVDGGSPETREYARQALEHNEPAVLEALKDVDRDRRVRQLVTVAKDVVECARGDENEELCTAIKKLEKLSKTF